MELIRFSLTVVLLPRNREAIKKQIPYRQETIVTMSPEKDHVLAIEDESDILEVIQYNLEREGYAVTTTQNGEEGLQLVREEKPDLVLLDLMLPDMDGIEICKQVRSDEETRRIPVIMVTAKDTDSEVVLGLGVGADDYITKPFNPKELVARVNAVLRRSKFGEDEDEETSIVHGNLEIYPERHRVKKNGEDIEFTATEFRLLHHLASNPGRVYSREQLVENVLGTIVTERNIDVHVRAIRKKLDDEGDLIETVRGVGYRFKETEP